MPLTPLDEAETAPLISDNDTEVVSAVNPKKRRRDDVARSTIQATETPAFKAQKKTHDSEATSSAKTKTDSSNDSSRRKKISPPDLVAFCPQSSPATLCGGCKLVSRDRSQRYTCHCGHSMNLAGGRTGNVLVHWKSSEYLLVNFGICLQIFTDS